MRKKYVVFVPSTQSLQILKFLYLLQNVDIFYVHKHQFLPDRREVRSSGTVQQRLTASGPLNRESTFINNNICVNFDQFSTTTTILSVPFTRLIYRATRFIITCFGTMKTSLARPIKEWIFSRGESEAQSVVIVCGLEPHKTCVLSCNITIDSRCYVVGSGRIQMT